MTNTHDNDMDRISKSDSTGKEEGSSELKMSNHSNHANGNETPNFECKESIPQNVPSSSSHRSLVDSAELFKGLLRKDDDEDNQSLYTLSNMHRTTTHPLTSTSAHQARVDSQNVHQTLNGKDQGENHGAHTMDLVAQEKNALANQSLKEIQPNLTEAATIKSRNEIPAVAKSLHVEKVEEESGAPASDGLLLEEVTSNNDADTPLLTIGSTMSLLDSEDGDTSGMLYYPKARLFHMVSTGRWSENEPQGEESSQEDSEWVPLETGYVTVAKSSKGDYFVIVMISLDKEEMLLEKKLFQLSAYEKNEDTMIVWQDADTFEDFALSFETEQGRDSVWLDMQLHDADIKVMNALHYQGLPKPTVDDLPTMIQYLCLPIFPCTKNLISQSILKTDYIDKLLEEFERYESSEDCEVKTLEDFFHVFNNLFGLNSEAVLKYLLAPSRISKVVGPLEYDPSLQARREHRKFLNDDSRFKEIIPFHDDELLVNIHQLYRLQYVKDVATSRTLDEGAFNSLNSLLYDQQLTVLKKTTGNEEFLKKLFDGLCDLDLPLEKYRDLAELLQELCSIAKGVHASHKVDLFCNLASHGMVHIFAPMLTHPDPSIKVIGADVFSCVCAHEPTLIRMYITTLNKETSMKSNSQGQTRASETETEDGEDEVEEDEDRSEDGVKDGNKDARNRRVSGEIVVNESEALKDTHSNFETKPAQEKTEPDSENSPSLDEKGKGGSSASALLSVSKPTDADLLDYIIAMLVCSEAESLEVAQQYMIASSHLLMALQVILDPSTMQEPAEKEDMLDLFYSQCMPAIVKPLDDILPGSKKTARGYVSTRIGSSVLHTILDLLSFCLQLHRIRIRMYLLKNRVLEKVLSLLQYTNKCLRLEVVIFFRLVVGANDDFYHRHIVKRKLFGPIIKLFIENGPKYNLVNSSILEIFELLLNGKITRLVRHVCKLYRSTMEKVTYVDTFQRLLGYYDTLLVPPDPVTGGFSRAETVQLEAEDQEDYFDASSDDEASAVRATPSPIAPLDPTMTQKPMVKGEMSSMDDANDASSQEGSSSSPSSQIPLTRADTPHPSRRRNTADFSEGLSNEGGKLGNLDDLPDFPPLHLPKEEEDEVDLLATAREKANSQLLRSVTTSKISLPNVLHIKGEADEKATLPQVDSKEESQVRSAENAVLASVSSSLVKRKHEDPQGEKNTGSPKSSDADAPEMEEASATPSKRTKLSDVSTEEKS